MKAFEILNTHGELIASQRAASLKNAVRLLIKKVVLLRRADLQRANLQGADLQGADLQRADLRGADLQDAYLRGADLDYSCFPLWCGSFDMTTDIRLPAQLAYHFCRLKCDDLLVQEAQKYLVPLANKFHRVDKDSNVPSIKP